MNSLFVYGTLAPGERNAHIMDGMTGTWQKASVRGKKFIKGWGRSKLAPGFFPDPNGDLVKGLIFRSNDLPAHWQRLDDFEGADYQRVEIEAILDTGELITTFIYRAVPRT
ncbi:MAG: gamma-glutamylcyclotransferase [Hyphomonadaceae bacterium]|nr:gamma-glutamylcyclotransferase [Hyphomonadaceae bacterium]